MLYLYNLYLLFCYMRNIYGIYVALRFFKYILGSTYDFFMYTYSYLIAEPEIKLLCDKRRNTYTEI